MPDTTPNYDLPFPEDGDPTDVAGDFERLAGKVDEELVRVDVDISDAKTDLSSHNSQSPPGSASTGHHIPTNGAVALGTWALSCDAANTAKWANLHSYYVPRTGGTFTGPTHFTQFTEIDRPYNAGDRRALVVGTWDGSEYGGGMLSCGYMRAAGGVSGGGWYFNLVVNRLDHWTTTGWLNHGGTVMWNAAVRDAVWYDTDHPEVTQATAEDVELPSVYGGGRDLGIGLDSDLLLPTPEGVDEDVENRPSLDTNQLLMRMVLKIQHLEQRIAELENKE